MVTTGHCFSFLYGAALTSLQMWLLGSCTSIASFRLMTRSHQAPRPHCRCS